MLSVASWTKDACPIDFFYVHKIPVLNSQHDSLLTLACAWCCLCVPSLKNILTISFNQYCRINTRRAHFMFSFVLYQQTFLVITLYLFLILHCKVFNPHFILGDLNEGNRISLAKQKHHGQHLSKKQVSVVSGIQHTGIISPDKRKLLRHPYYSYIDSHSKN